MHNSKSFEQVEVKDIKITRNISTRTSNICFIHVEYSNKSPKVAPKQLFLKMGNKKFLWGQRMAKREVLFYNAITNQLGDLLIIPCYDAKFNENTGGSHILLEDKSKTHFHTEYPIPPSYINCERHIEGFTKLHSLMWDDERLKEFAPWSKDYWNKIFDYEKELRKSRRLVRKFLKFLGDRISKTSQNILNNSIEFFLKYELESHKEGKNLTLIHQDAHAWNVFYPKEGIDGKMFIFDWDSFTVFKGVYDIAYFMGVYWHPERRKRFEEVLLRKYHEKLGEFGITNYSWNECYNVIDQLL